MSIFWVWIIIIVTVLRPSAEDAVDQARWTMTVTEGNPLSIPCSYEAHWSITNEPFWYVHHPGQAPRFLLSEGQNHNRGFQAFHIQGENKRKGSFDLEKATSQLNDSASYFCAFTYGGGSSKLTFGAGTKLHVIPNLEDSEPSVYQLKSSKEPNNIAACLVTDYSPNPINVNISRTVGEPTNGSLVVVKDGNKESASLGVVLWGKNDDDFHCSATYKNISYEAEKSGADMCSETTPSGLLEEPVFETDERLNLLSLTVLGLRLIFFKSVALNLILTYHAWSR